MITGGQRSGKSRYAEEIAEQEADRPLYLATARIWDQDFAERIRHHRQNRGANWRTIEEEINISRHMLSGETVLLDCITLWLTNIFFDHRFNVEDSLTFAKEEWNNFTGQSMTLIVVTNELGMGVHPENESGRKFADLQGLMNRHIAETADSVFLMVSGIPVKIK